MDFNLTEQQKMMQQLFNQFAINEVKPIAEQVDDEEMFPLENVKAMGALGMLGIPFPREYGGAGGDNLTYAMCVEALSKVCGTTGVIVSAHTSLCASPIYMFGTEEQKRRFLPDLCTGRKIGAFGLTEPAAGTDAGAQQTKAFLEGDHYRINGSKIFITNAGYADTYIIFAMTDKSLGIKGITAFIVEKGMEGFSIGKKERKMGIRGSATCELIFKDVMVPVENRLGKEKDGFKIAMKTLDGGRIGIASQALGISQGALDETLNYIKERKQFGRSLAKFQNVQFNIADMTTQTEAARMLVYKAANMKDKDQPYSKEAAMAKLYAAQVAMDVTTKAVQLHGGYGYTREYPVERMMRDAKITEIYEGTNEVQKMVISSAVLR